MKAQVWNMLISLAVAFMASLAFAYTIGWWLVWLGLFCWALLFAYSAREVLRDEEKKQNDEKKGQP